MITSAPIELTRDGRPATKAQRPSEKVPYRLTVSGGAISTAPWTISPTGPTVTTPVNASSPTDSTSDVFVSGVAASTTYTLECTATLSSGAIYTGVIYILGVAQ